MPRIKDEKLQRFSARRQALKQRADNNVLQADRIRAMEAIIALDKARDAYKVEKKAKTAAAAVLRAKQKKFKSAKVKASSETASSATVGSSSSSSSRLTEHTVTEAVVQTQSHTEEESVSRTTTTGQVNENRHVVEVEVKDAFGNTTTKRVIDSTTGTSYEEIREEAKHTTTKTNTLAMITSESLLTIITNEVDMDGSMRLFRSFLAMSEVSYNAMGRKTSKAIEGMRFDDRLAIPLLYMLNAAESPAAAGGWHHGAVTLLTAAYEKLTGIDTDESCSTPLLLPCVISHRWNTHSWRWLVDNVFKYDPIGLIEERASGFLARRFEFDLSYTRMESMPTEPTVALHAMENTIKTGVWYTDAFDKMYAEVKAKHDSIELIDDELFRRTGELYRYATVQQYHTVREYANKVNEIQASITEGGTVWQKQTKNNLEGVQRVVDNYKIGIGTLVTAKLMFDASNPEYNTTTDVAPGTIVKASSEQKAEVTPLKLKVDSTGEIVDLDTLPVFVQRDVRRGMGVRSLNITQNPAKPEGFTGYVKSKRSKQTPKKVNYTRVIQPNGTMNETEWNKLVTNPNDDVAHLGQFVLTFDLYLYTTPGADGVVREIVIEDVKVCPAPPNIVALYKRTQACDEVRLIHRVGVATRERARAKLRARADRDAGIAEKARLLSLYLPEGYIRQCNYDDHVSRLTYRARQLAIREDIATWPDFD
jgi:hypothetical protein